MAEREKMRQRDKQTETLPSIGSVLKYLQQLEQGQTELGA